MTVHRIVGESKANARITAWGIIADNSKNPQSSFLGCRHMVSRLHPEERT
jgi:hypothetical protein